MADSTVNSTQRATFNAPAAAGTAFFEQDHGLFAVSGRLKSNNPDGTGGHTTAAAAANFGINDRNRQDYNPRSICFQVNSGLDCLREKG